MCDQGRFCSDGVIGDDHMTPVTHIIIYSLNILFIMFSHKISLINEHIQVAT